MREGLRLHLDETSPHSVEQPGGVSGMVAMQLLV